MDITREGSYKCISVLVIFFLVLGGICLTNDEVGAEELEPGEEFSEGTEALLYLAMAQINADPSNADEHIHKLIYILRRRLERVKELYDQAKKSGRLTEQQDQKVNNLIIDAEDNLDYAEELYYEAIEDNDLTDKEVANITTHLAKSSDKITMAYNILSDIIESWAYQLEQQRQRVKQMLEKAKRGKNQLSERDVSISQSILNDISEADSHYTSVLNNMNNPDGSITDRDNLYKISGHLDEAQSILKDVISNLKEKMRKNLNRIGFEKFKPVRQRVKVLENETIIKGGTYVNPYSGFTLDNVSLQVVGPADSIVTLNSSEVSDERIEKISNINGGTLVIYKIKNVRMKSSTDYNVSVIYSDILVDSDTIDDRLSWAQPQKVVTGEAPQLSYPEILLEKSADIKNLSESNNWRYLLKVGGKIDMPSEDAFGLKAYRKGEKFGVTSTNDTLIFDMKSDNINLNLTMKDVPLEFVKDDFELNINQMENYVTYDTTIKNKSSRAYEDVLALTKIPSPDDMSDATLSVMDGGEKNGELVDNNGEILLKLSHIDSKSDRNFKIKITDITVRKYLLRILEQLRNYRDELRQEAGDLPKRYRIYVEERLEYVTKLLDRAESLIYKEQYNAALSVLIKSELKLRKIDRMIDMLMGNTPSIIKGDWVPVGITKAGEKNEVMAIDRVVNNGHHTKPISYTREIPSSIDKSSVVLFVDNDEANFEWNENTIVYETQLGKNQEMSFYVKGEGILAEIQASEDYHSGAVPYIRTNPHPSDPIIKEFIIEHSQILDAGAMVRFTSDYPSETCTKLYPSAATDHSTTDKVIPNDSNFFVDYKQRRATSVFTVSLSDWIPTPLYGDISYDQKSDGSLEVTQKCKVVNHADFEYTDVVSVPAQLVASTEFSNYQITSSSGADIEVEDKNWENPIKGSYARINIPKIEPKETVEYTLNYTVDDPEKAVEGYIMFLTRVFEELNLDTRERLDDDLWHYFIPDFERVMHQSDWGRGDIELSEEGGYLDNAIDSLDTGDWEQALDYASSAHSIVRELPMPITRLTMPYSEYEHIRSSAFKLREELNGIHGALEPSRGIQGDVSEDIVSRLEESKEKIDSAERTYDNITSEVHSNDKEMLIDSLEEMTEATRNLTDTYNETYSRTWSYIDKKRRSLSYISQSYWEMIPLFKKYEKEGLISEANLELDKIKDNLTKLDSTLLELEDAQKVTDLETSIVKLNSAMDYVNNIEDLIARIDDDWIYKLLSEVKGLKETIIFVSNKLDSAGVLTQVTEDLDNSVSEADTYISEGESFLNNNRLFSARAELIKARNILDLSLQRNKDKINNFTTSWLENSRMLSLKVKSLKDYIIDTGGEVPQSVMENISQFEHYLQQESIPKRENIKQTARWLSIVIPYRQSVTEEIRSIAKSQLETLIDELDKRKEELINYKSKLNSIITALEKGVPHDVNREEFDNMLGYAKKAGLNIPINESQFEKDNEMQTDAIKLISEAVKQIDNLEVNTSVTTMLNKFELYYDTKNTVENAESKSENAVQSLSFEYSTYKETIDETQKDAKVKMRNAPNDSDYRRALMTWFNLSESFEKDNSLYESLVYATAILGMSPENYENVPGNLQPIASFTKEINNLKVDVDASDSYDTDGSIVGYEWKWKSTDSFSNGSETDSYEYNSGGNYRISLRVTDNGGKTATTSKMITVTGADNEEGQTYTVSGHIKIIYDDNRIVYPADVSISLGATSTSSTNSGYYEIPYVEEGEHTLSVSFSDYDSDLSDESKVFEINRDRVIVVEKDAKTDSADFKEGSPNDRDGDGVPDDKDPAPEDPRVTGKGGFFSGTSLLLLVLALVATCISTVFAYWWFYMKDKEKSEEPASDFAEFDEEPTEDTFESGTSEEFDIDEEEEFDISEDAEETEEFDFGEESGEVDEDTEEIFDVGEEETEEEDLDFDLEEEEETAESEDEDDIDLAI